MAGRSKVRHREKACLEVKS